MEKKKCSRSEILKKANIPSEIAYEVETELDKKFVAKDPFPPIKWDREVMMPIQQEQFRTSERLERLSDKMDSFRIEMDAKFDAVDTRFVALESTMNAKFEAIDAKFVALESKMDAKFQSIEERFRTFTWMQGLLLIMIAAIFTKMFFG
ncbi:MAG: hypothetical protein O9264_08020 [Leptospira sp.]|nr:hypothetical protein [Leptospira sp.]